jgi:hypothetical protein
MVACAAEVTCRGLEAGRWACMVEPWRRSGIVVAGRGSMVVLRRVAYRAGTFAGSSGGSCAQLVGCGSKRCGCGRCARCGETVIGHLPFAVHQVQVQLLVYQLLLHFHLQAPGQSQVLRACLAQPADALDCSSCRLGSCFEVRWLITRVMPPRFRTATEDS